MTIFCKPMKHVEYKNALKIKLNTLNIFNSIKKPKCHPFKYVLAPEGLEKSKNSNKCFQSL